MLVHARERVPAWADAWRRTGRLVLLLDFDGTLAPIVDRPEEAAMPPATRRALERLRALPGVEAAVVSGRGLADVRERAAIPGIAYAGNHGMEIHGPGVERVHPEAAAARPVLAAAARALERVVADVPGAWVEDKVLTLSVHFRLAPREHVGALTQAVAGTAALLGLRMTTGKEVLEVRPPVDWDKGRAVLFLLEQMRPPAGAPALYLGDDRTDEDAFRAVRAWGPSGEGVLVADPVPPDTAAASYLRDPAEVGALFDALAEIRKAEG
ncbi:MAG TPA: trehalose-phosphatase [Longimicrobiaceae bacterium]|nr:trehalose-phosphatase [Longimicrobiaceae bacterium]